MKPTRFIAAIAFAFTVGCTFTPQRIERGSLHLLNLRDTQAYYLIESNTHLCALSWGQAVIAVDCATLAASVPEARALITWLPAPAPAAPPPAAPPT